MPVVLHAVLWVDHTASVSDSLPSFCGARSARVVYEKSRKIHFRFIYFVFGICAVTGIWGSTVANANA